MPTLRLHIAYAGTHYHGWQKQRGLPTVEGEILKGLQQILNGADFEFQGASRTDAGVHALGQVASLVHETSRVPWDFVRGLNALTEDDITINHAEEVADGFNARHDSRGKIYRYTIWNYRFHHPLLKHLMWRVKETLDVDRMRIAAAYLVGTFDFSSFRAADCQAKSTMREIRRVDIKVDDRRIIIEVEGSAFLKYMVRIMVGTLVDVGSGLIAPDDLPKIIEAKDRAAAGVTAQPQGLQLVEVFYPSHLWTDQPMLGNPIYWEPNKVGK